MIKLKNLDKTGDKFFRVYKESDMPGFDFSHLRGKKGEEVLVDSTQDDDVNTDTDVLNSGTNKCYKDLLIVKDYLRHKPEKVRRSLKTWKLWTPYFLGELPMKTLPKKRFQSQEKIEGVNNSATRRTTC